MTPAGAKQSPRLYLQVSQRRCDPARMGRGRPVCRSRGRWRTRNKRVWRLLFWRWLGSSCSRCVLRFCVPPALAGLPRQPLQLGIVGREPETSCSRIWVLQACSARARLPRLRPRRHVALGVGHLLRLRLELGVSHECCCVEPLLDICDGRQMRCMIEKL